MRTGAIAMMLASTLVVMVPAQDIVTPPEEIKPFRSISTGVPVNVSVRNGRDPVNDLTREDFRLTDDGVPQVISTVFSDSTPVDVTLLVDTSGSVVGSLGAFRADVQRIANMLRPDEQMRLVTFDTDLREILPMQNPSGRMPVDQIKLGELTSFLDALMIGLSRPYRVDRRHFVFAFTDGIDTASVLDYGALPEIASHSGAFLHIALVKTTDGVTKLPSAALEALTRAAARTGGALYPATAQTSNVVRAFEQALEAFRHSYTLYFSPKDAGRPGWHPLDVKVVKRGNVEVQARQGYYGS